MNDVIIFILVLFLAVLPLAIIIYRFKYKNTILLKTSYSIISMMMILSLASFFVGHYGLKQLIWYIPLGYLALLMGNTLFKNFVQIPIKQTNELLKKFSRGDYTIEVSKKHLKSNDEIGELNRSLEEMLKNFKESAEFARKVGEGNTDYKIELLSESDLLRLALIEMREKLLAATKLQEKKKIEDQQRQWVNEGIAKSAEILRQHNNLEDLSFEILKYLVEYLHANQGGVFIKNDDDEDAPVVFELKAAIAYDRRKYMQRTVELGEGIVGTVAVEKEKMYMTELPGDYISITSGLGGANPNSLLVVPLKIEDEVLGVLEIASFNMFEEFEIEFVEKISHNIASTLKTVSINQKTALLLERTQQQAEEMAAQEEEMRQNMEELQATQEESARKSEEMEGLLAALNQASFITEYDVNGYITEINDSYLNFLNERREDVIGTHHSEKMSFSDDQKKNYDNFWKELRQGKIKREKTTLSLSDGNYTLIESYTPIKDYDGNVIKILKIANDLKVFK